jgi:trans-2,3-dihydro-3-hydroxyanthranilate isomerase
MLSMAATTPFAGFSAADAAPPTRQFAYQQWDVFTSTPLAGNPLAVFLDARGLTDADMLAIARETNLSETTFIFPREAAIEKERGTRVRIFTREQELPFAGHPTLGTAMAIRAGRTLPRITLDLNAGPIPVTFEQTVRGAYGEMLQPEPVFAETHTIASIAGLMGLTSTDFDEAFPIENISTGRPNLIVMLKSLAAIAKAQPDWPAVQRYFANGDKQRGFYLMTRETLQSSARIHARKPSRAGDDPVTGSAAGCAAAYLVSHKLAKPEERVIIEQGSEVHRPGELFVTAGADGKSNVRAGGYAVQVFEGKLTL